MALQKVVLLGLATLLLTAGGAMAAPITIATVPVGNPGNAADTAARSGNAAGQGAVSYAYNIGTYEVTAGQYTAFLNAVAGVDTYLLYNAAMWSDSSGCKIERYAGSGTAGDPYQYRVASDYANRPVNYVSWGDAARFANWLNNGQPTGAQDLATTEDGAYLLNGATSNAALLAVSREADWKWAITGEDEWYKAAYYDPGTGTYFDYPTSSNTAPGRDLADASENNANFVGAPYPIDSGKYTTVAGEFQNSDSPYGTFDQGGNVWEWNEAVLDSSDRGLRGGSFNYNSSYLLTSARGLHFIPTYENFYLGFRVSQVPEPGTIALLALGSAGVLLRRRTVRR